MSWFRRAERGGGGHGEHRERLTDVSFEYLPLSPTALMRVSARWPEGETEAPDVQLIVSDGAGTHELDPLPDPAAGDHTGWRAAFTAPLSLVEGSGVAFALRLGGEDLPLSAPEARQLDVEADAAVFDSHDERLAAIAASLARRDDMDDQLRDLAAQIKSSRAQAAELERRADDAEVAEADAERRAEEAEAARVAAEETLNELIEMHSSLKEQTDAQAAERSGLDGRLERLESELATVRNALDEQRAATQQAEQWAADLGKARAEAERRAEEADDQLGEAERRVGEIEQDAEEVAARVAEAEALAAAAEERGAGLRDERDEAERRAEESESARAEAERLVAEAEAARQEAERRIRDTDEARDEALRKARDAEAGVEDRVAAAEQRGEELETRVAELESELADARRKAAEAEAARSDAEGRSESAEARLAETTDRTQGVVDRSEELEQLLAVAGAEREKLERRMKEQDEVLGGLKDELAVQTHHVGELEQAAIDTDAERARLRVLNDDHVAQLERVRAELTSLQTELAGSEPAKLLAALITARDRLVEAERRHETEHLTLTRSLFEDQEGSASEERLQSTVDAEQTARTAVEEAAEELEQAWARAGALAARGRETGGGNPAGEPTSHRA